MGSSKDAAPELGHSWCSNVFLELDYKVKQYDRLNIYYHVPVKYNIQGICVFGHKSWLAVSISLLCQGVIGWG